MHHDFDNGQPRNTSISSGGMDKNDTFRTGVTNYERPKGILHRKNNPYNRSNMIYAKKRRSKAPAIVVVVVAIVVIAAIVAYLVTHP